MCWRSSNTLISFSHMPRMSDAPDVELAQPQPEPLPPQEDEQKPTVNEFRKAQEQAALDRIKARQLEAKIQMLQHGNAVINAQRQESTVE